MTATLRTIADNLSLVLLAIGIVIILAAWLRFSISFGSRSIQNPSSGSGRIVLTLVGASLAGWGGWLLVTHPISPTLSDKRVRQQYAHVSLSGTETDCARGECRLAYYVSGRLEAPKGAIARYEDRIKTSGRIAAFRTIPKHTKINEDQFAGNPTYLEFAIDPPKPDDTQMQVMAEVVLTKRLVPHDGKVGLHLPYQTDHATLIVDFTQLGFRPAATFQPQIEQRTRDDILQTGLAAPLMTVWNDGRVAILSARDVPAGSSIILAWSSPQQPELELIPERFRKEFATTSTSNTGKAVRGSHGWSVDLHAARIRRGAKRAAGWAGYCWEFPPIDARHKRLLAVDIAKVSRSIPVQFKLEREEASVQETVVRPLTAGSNLIDLGSFESVREAVARFCIVLQAAATADADLNFALNRVALR